MKTRAFSTLSIAFVFLANIAFAEGTVNGPVDAGGGPYRRVQTQPIGYKAVTAHFTVPTIFLPNSHDARSTPTFYVGGGSTNGNVEVDAGMNYEPTIKNGVPPGWTAYVRVARGPNPGSVGANGWRSNATTNPNVTSYDLTWIVNPDNTGYLLIQANGADVQPGNNGRIDASAGNQIFNDQTGIYVKRVLGVSQGAGLSRGSYEEDGTYMRGCILSNPGLKHLGFGSHERLCL